MGSQTQLPSTLTNTKLDGRKLSMLSMLKGAEFSIKAGTEEELSLHNRLEELPSQSLIFHLSTPVKEKNLKSLPKLQLRKISKELRTITRIQPLEQRELDSTELNYTSDMDTCLTLSFEAVLTTELTSMEDLLKTESDTPLRYLMPSLKSLEVEE